MRGAVPPSVQLLLYGVAVTLLGCLGAVIRPSAGAVRLWWPAAGIAVVGLLLARPRQRPLVVGTLMVAGTLGHLYGGRPVLVAVLLALVNIVGAIVAGLALSYRRPEPLGFHDLSDLMRLLLAIVLGALTAGATAGAAGAWLLGSAFVATSAGVAASHASSVLLVMPFALRTPSAPAEATRLELVAQWVATVTVTVLVFAPGQGLRLTFLLLPVLLWPALRSSVRATAVLLLTAGVLGAVLSLRGGGPFATFPQAGSRSEQLTIILVQVLIITTSSVMLTVLVTVAQRRQLLLDTARREELFRVGFTESLLGLLLVRAAADGMRIVELNGVAARLLGGRAAELIGTVWCDPFAAADRGRIEQAVASMEAGRATGWHGEVHMTGRGDDRWVELSISPTVEGTAAGDLVTVQMVDVTARREAEARLADLALRDGLTGLANRMLLDDRLERALADAARTGLGVGVMFLDLDEFKTINDTYGHAAGDLVLVEVSSRLLSAVRPSDTVARMGGDEFVIVCPDLPDGAVLNELHDRVVDALSAPAIVGGSDRRIRASIGMTLGDAGSDARELLREADAGMYAHKTASRSTTVAQAAPARG